MQEAIRGIIWKMKGLAFASVYTKDSRSHWVSEEQTWLFWWDNSISACSVMLHTELSFNNDWIPDETH